MKRLTITIPVPESARLLKAVWGYLLAALLVAPSLLWIAEDHRVWPWDQALYGEVSVDSWYWLTNSFVKWLQTAADELSSKPPAIVWIGQFFVPLKGLFGSVEVSLLVFVVLTQFVLLLLLFRIGSILSQESRLVAATGVVFAAGSQLFVGLSHQFFVEPLQAVAVAWAFLIALQAPEWSKSRILLHLAANFAFGLLVKASTPAYCWPVWLYCLFVMLRKPGDIAFFSEWKSRSFRAFAIVTCTSVLLCAFWYLRHLSEVWQHVRESSSSEIALDYGARDTVVHKMGTWLHIMDQSFLAPYLVWACLIALGVASVLVWRGRRSRLQQGSRLPPIAILSIVQIAALLFLFSINISVNPRYAYGMLPCLAILFITAFTALPRKAIAALLLLCGVRWVIVSYASFSPGKVIGYQSEWLYEPQRDRTDFDELTRAVSMTSTIADRYNVIGVEYPWMNANSAAFFAAKNRLTTGVRSAYISIGYAQKDLDAAMRRIVDFHVAHLVTLAADSQDPSPNFLNLVSRGVVETIQRDHRFSRLPFPSKMGILVFEFHSDSSTPAQTGAQPVLQPSELTLVPSGIARGKIEKRGHSSLDAVNSLSPQQDHFKRTFLVRANGDMGSCTGWAFDDLRNSTPEEVWIELTNTETGQRYYWPTHRYDRPELAAAVKVPSVRRSGFNCQPVKYALPTGTYTTKVYQVDGGTAIVSDLNTYEPSPTIVVK